jgi:hypothetical protein
VSPLLQPLPNTLLILLVPWASCLICMYYHLLFHVQSFRKRLGLKLHTTPGSGMEMMKWVFTF